MVSFATVRRLGCAVWARPYRCWGLQRHCPASYCPATLSPMSAHVLTMALVALAHRAFQHCQLTRLIPGLCSSTAVCNNACALPLWTGDAPRRQHVFIYRRTT
jgi:hypothetical protein